jgi:alpha-amylase/alpha-mannosidase (GH57 family)
VAEGLTGKSITVHAHFYQPPREDPWTGEIPEQPSAAPAHDWNERVHQESYRPNAFASVSGDEGDRTVNNFEKMSFNVGPTLLAWMEKADPETYERIIEADRASAEAVGHGNAIAQAYHHTILPLSPLRDVRTQVRWGLADFRFRYGREPAAMWLPETAANDDTLEVLIEEGLTYTILAPNQAGYLRDEDGTWIPVQEVGLDTTIPYRYMHRDGSGRSLALFFYDGAISRAIAFERAGASGEGFMDLFEAKAQDGRLVHAATDGETYGHHHTFSELGLAYALFVEADVRSIEVTNYAGFLQLHPAEREVRLIPGEGTSWSCAHGVGRWKEDCGCMTGGEEGWNQSWRGPLRKALELVRDAVDEVYDRMGAQVFSDPWATRDRYVDVVIGRTELDDFLSTEASGPLAGEEARRAADLLELQRNSMSMFTSCGWFFNDIGGIETIQVLAYAARTLDLLESLGQSGPRDSFLATLHQARSNDPEVGTGADVFAGTYTPTS